MGVLLEARRLSRRHPRQARWLLEDVSLQICAGECVAIVGPTGTGKTLLLRALVLLDPLQGGEILFLGRSAGASGVPAYRGAVMYLHQRPSLMAETVEAALRHPLALKMHRRRPFPHSWIVQTLGRLGRGEAFLEQHVVNLSGGELQIAALLRVLLLSPRVLLLDEPTAALDPQTTASVESLLRDWLAEAPDLRAVLWVSHDARQADRVAGRKLRMQDGRIT